MPLVTVREVQRGPVLTRCQGHGCERMGPNGRLKASGPKGREGFPKTPRHAAADVVMIDMKIQADVSISPVDCCSKCKIRAHHDVARMGDKE